MSFERCAPSCLCAQWRRAQRWMMNVPKPRIPAVCGRGNFCHADNNEDMTNMHSRGSSTAEPASVVTSRPAPQRHSHRDVYFGLGH